MISKNKYKLILILLFFQICALSVSKVEAQQTDLKIEGSIVLFDSSPPGAGALNMDGGTSTYVVKISKTIDGKESSNYILMITGQNFSKSHFNLKKKLRFNLARTPVFDDKIKNYLDLNEKNDERKNITRLLLSKGVKLEDIPLNETLPGYYLRSYESAVK